jgi:polar amino acid transport system permease protein
MNPIIQFFTNLFTLNGTFNWKFVTQFVFSAPILQGLLLTGLIAVFAQTIGSVIGLILYFMRRSQIRFLRWLANAYIWFFRGTPLLVQVLLFASFFSQTGLASPSRLRSVEISPAFGFVYEIFLDSLLALVLALSLNEGAYMSEIVRAGIDAIDVGQIEAAKSLGMTYGQAMRRVVLPQALRVIVPPLGNEFNSMLKSTAAGYIVSFPELLGAASQIANPRAALLELFFVASIWYLILTSIWTIIQSVIERRLNISNIDPALLVRKPWWQRTFGFGDRGVTAPLPAPAHT